MLLETSITLPLSSFTVGPISPPADPTPIRIPGATVLVASQFNPGNVDAALNSLREFRTAGRRIVWCNTSELARAPGADLRQWGRRAVENCGAEMVVVCGQGARDAAVGARDAGLPLGRVIVCRDEATARNVLGDSISSGDAVLALGIGIDGCQRLADRLESRFSRAETGARRIAAT